MLDGGMPVAEEEIDRAARKPEGGSLRHVALDDALAHRTPRRVRAALVALTGIVLALALLPVWRSLAALRQAAPAPADQGVAVEVTSSITTGAVTLNGRRIGIHLPLLLYLRPGVNVIALDAPPFRTRTCRITAPAGAADDTCRGLGVQPPLKGDQRFYGTAEHQVVSAYVVTFLLGLTDLPTDLQMQALATVSASLSQRLATMVVAVRPGDHFATGLAATGVPIVGRTTAPLLATPIATLSRLAGVYICEADVCPYFDDSTFGDTASTTSDPNWTVWLGVTLGWRFTALSGAEVRQILFRAGLIGPIVAVTLAYHTGTGWYVPKSSALDDRLRGEVALGLCIDGADTFSTQESNTQQDVLLIGEGGGATLEGCSLTVRRFYGDQRSAETRVLWRFGALLAADPASRALFPVLPLASPQEVAAVGA
jgi:hypothetical protein